MDKDNEDSAEGWADGSTEGWADESNDGLDEETAEERTEVEIIISSDLERAPDRQQHWKAIKSR